MKFSLLVPTRERPQGLIRLLDSLVLMTDEPHQVEILIAIDHDDEISRANVENIKNSEKYKDFTIISNLRHRTEFLNQDYYNWLAALSKGELIWALADDLKILVEHWDSIVYNRVTSYISNKKDKIACAGIKDNTPKPKTSLPQFPCFPCITRAAYNFMGFILHPQVPTWGADYLLYLLYTGAERYLNIDDNVYLEHISWHTRSVKEDVVGARIRQIFGRLQHIPQHNIDRLAAGIIPDQIKNMKNHIHTIGLNQ